MYKEVLNGEEVKIIVRGDRHTGKIGKIVYSMSLGSTEKHIVSFEDGGSGEYYNNELKFL